MNDDATFTDRFKFWLPRCVIASVVAAVLHVVLMCC